MLSLLVDSSETTQTIERRDITQTFSGTSKNPFFMVAMVDSSGLSSFSSSYLPRLEQLFLNLPQKLHIKPTHLLSRNFSMHGKYFVKMFPEFSVLL